jgi:hypothetical protein
MATDSTTAKIEIEVEARTDAAVENFNKLKKAQADAKASLVELDKQFEKNATTALGSTGKMADGFGKAKDAAKQLAPSLVGLGVAAAQGNVNLGNIAATALAATQAFGPWGIAIGVAATALYGLVKAQDEAAAAARRHEVALRNQLQQKFSSQSFARDEADRLKNLADTERKVLERGGHAAMRESLLFLEEDLVVAEARREKTGAILTQQAKVRSDLLRLEAHAAETMGRMDERRRLIGEADALLRADKLRSLHEENELEEKKTASKREQLRLTGEELALQGRAGRRFDAGLGAATDRQIVAGGSADESSATRFGGELIDPFSKENELQAVAQAEEKRLRAREALKEELAEADKKRDEEELARKDELQKRHDSMSEAISGAMGNIAATTLQAALAGEVGIKKLLGAWGRAESIKLAAIALSEGVQAVVAAATWNIPQAIQHGEAAAQAAATAAVVAAMTGAVGGFGSVSVGSAGNGKGFGMGGSASGNDFGGGSGPAANSAPSSTNSQKDQLPTAEYNVQQSGTANMGPPSGGGTVNNYNFAANSVVSLGRIDNETGLKLAQGIDEAKRNLGWTG